MAANLTAEGIREMSDDQAVEAIRSSTMRDLAAMPRPAVEALPEAARRARRDLLLSDRTIWGIRHIMAAANVSRDAVARWRNNYLAIGHEDESALIRPCNEDDADIKRPGDPRDAPRGSDSPAYYAGEVRRWLITWERMDEDMFPLRKTSPGRTPQVKGE